MTVTPLHMSSTGRPGEVPSYTLVYLDHDGALCCETDPPSSIWDDLGWRPLPLHLLEAAKDPREFLYRYTKGMSL